MREGISDNIIELRKGDNPNWKRRFEVSSRTQMTDLGVDYKFFIEGHSADSDSGEKMKAKLILKRLNRGVFKDIESDDEPADLYYKRWQVLRRAGIPTVPSMRIVSKKEILMSDMTIDGSTFFGKDMKLRMDEGEMFDTNPVFKDLNLWEDVFVEAKKIADLATKMRIELPGDDPMELLVSPDGSWRLVVLDLSQVCLNEKPSAVKYANQASLRRFEEWLLLIKNNND